jgi:hypothetical protein
MILSAHQLNYLPYPGLIAKINYSDKFLYLSNLQFEKKSWQSRNKMMNNGSEILLSIPIKNKNKIQLIKDVEINNEINWKKKHLKTIQYNYKKAKYFKRYIKFFEKLYENNWIKLNEITEYILLYVMKELNIETEILSDKNYNFKEKKNDFLIEICKKFDATTYVSNKGSEDYIDLTVFKKNKINHYFVSYKNYFYRQQNNKKFVNNLSIFDMMFNCGPDETEKIIKNKMNLVISKNLQYL